MTVLRRGDAALIRKVLATNGGGMSSDFLPRAQLARLLDMGAVRFKPCRSNGGFATSIDAQKSRAMQAGYIIHGPNAHALLEGTRA